MRFSLRKIKSQVSVFVIIAVVIILGLGIFYFLKSGFGLSKDERYFYSPEIKPKFDNLRSSISDCLEQTTSDALDLIGFQGGYYKKPQEYMDLDYFFIPYYYKEGKILMPTKEKIEEEISNYVDDNLKICVNNASQDFFVNLDSSKTKTTINKGEVVFNINGDVRVEKEGKSTIIKLDKNPLSHRSKLYDILEISEYISYSHKDDPKMICITCVADMAKERDVFVEMYNVKDSIVLVELYENLTSENYVFEFLNKYPEN